MTAPAPRPSSTTTGRRPARGRRPWPHLRRSGCSCRSPPSSRPAAAAGAGGLEDAGGRRRDSAQVQVRLGRLPTKAGAPLAAGRPGPATEAGPVPWQENGLRSCENPGLNFTVTLKIPSRGCREYHVALLLGLESMAADRQLHDDLRGIYLRLKAPRFDLHWTLEIPSQGCRLGEYHSHARESRPSGGAPRHR
jgi:hypothetical protein